MYEDKNGNIWHEVTLARVSNLIEVENEWYNGRRFKLGLVCDDGTERYVNLDIDTDHGRNKGKRPTAKGARLPAFHSTASNLACVLKSDALARLIGSDIVRDPSDRNGLDAVIEALYSVDPDRLAELAPADFDLGAEMRGKRCKHPKGGVGENIRWLSVWQGGAQVSWGATMPGYVPPPRGKAAIKQPTDMADDVVFPDESEIF